MNQIHLHRDNIQEILDFINKYPDSDYITISVDSSSGIGSIVKASLPTQINGDHVVIEKTLVDETSW